MARPEDSAARTARLRAALDRVLQRGASAPSPESEQRLARLERRLDHLESLVEALQDSVHREGVRHDQQIEDLKKTTEPAQSTRALDRHAREKGL